MSRSSTARAAVPSISIVVAVRDDAVGSTGDSGDVIRALLRLDARVRRVCRMRAVGLSAALHVGFRAARGEVVVTLDADLQSDPRDTPKIQVGEIPASWSVPGLTLYRLRGTRRER